MVKESAGRAVNGQPTWLCECTCGALRIVYQGNLIYGLSQSCGCLQKERTSQATRKHGERNTPLYQTWINIRRRCNNPNHYGYQNYGGRGIRVCQEWEASYEAFRDYMLATCGERPDGCSIDRIDNDGNYEPGNVRWASRKEQARNRRPAASRAGSVIEAGLPTTQTEIVSLTPYLGPSRAA